MKKVVITGGHHNSALPVIASLYKEFPDIQLYWFGHEHSIKGDKNTTLEYNEITALNIPFYNLVAGKLYKTFDPIRLLKIPFGIFHALYLLLKIKPDLILSFGGYIAAPTVFAGYLLKIPSVTHEQTVVAGYANKFIAKFANKILISWPQSMVYFPANKTILTGIPLRKELTEIRSNSFVAENELPYIYVTAGKTGSHVINLALEGCLERLLNITNVIHQCGDTSLFNDFDNMQSTYNNIQATTTGVYFARKFVYSNEIGEAFSKASLIVSRAGAHTTSEILYMEKPAVLIPIPWVSHNEQNENALIVKNSGLGEILPEKVLNSDTLYSLIENMLSKINSYKVVNTENKKYIKEDAVDKVINELRFYLEN